MSHKLPNQHATKMIAKSFERNLLTDVRFVFESEERIQEVAAHKLVLALASPVFEAMFFGDFVEKDKQTVDMKDGTADAFKEFLQFFYLTEVTLTMENIEEVSRLADKYDMMECVNTCATFLIDKLTTENMCWGYQLATALKNDRLKQFCEKEIELYAAEVLKTNAFLRCSREVLGNILRMEKLSCDEVDVFDACLAWAKDACKRDEIDGSRSENLRAQLDDCIHLIRFGAIEIKILSQYLLKNKLRDFFTTGELEDIIFTTSGESFKSDHINRVPRTPSFQWNDSEELICKLSTPFVSGGKHYIRNTESVCFSTNVPLLLWRFDCSRIYGPTTTLNVSMFENDSEDSASHSSLSMFSENLIITNSSFTHNFPKIMVIKPRKVYEIRLEIPGTDLYINKRKSFSTDNLDSEATIEFHNAANNERSGIIPKLYFNRL